MSSGLVFECDHVSPEADWTVFSPVDSPSSDTSASTFAQTPRKFNAAPRSNQKDGSDGDRLWDMNDPSPLAPNDCFAKEPTMDLDSPVQPWSSQPQSSYVNNFTYYSLDTKDFFPYPHYGDEAVCYPQYTHDGLPAHEDEIIGDSTVTPHPLTPSIPSQGSHDLGTGSNNPPSFDTRSTLESSRSPGNRPDVPSQREKNRIAATKCRQKSKKNVSKLQERETELLSDNTSLKRQATALREEVLNLKQLILQHASCDSDSIQSYIQNAAKNVR